MLALIPKKYLIAISLLAALVIVLWFWRSEIYSAAENALSAAVNQKTIEVNEQSKKGAENVRKDVQSFDERQLDEYLCSLGIVQDNGCASDQLPELG